MGEHEFRVEASYKGNPGWLKLDIRNGKWVYAVTMDGTLATAFRSEEQAKRHMRRASSAGLSALKLSILV